MRPPSSAWSRTAQRSLSFIRALAGSSTCIGLPDHMPTGDNLAHDVVVAQRAAAVLATLDLDLDPRGDDREPYRTGRRTAGGCVADVDRRPACRRARPSEPTGVAAWTFSDWAMAFSTPPLELPTASMAPSTTICGRVDVAAAQNLGVFLLARGVLRAGQRVLPAEVVPVVDGKRQGDDAGAIGVGLEQRVGRRAGRAALAREQLHHGRALRALGVRGNGARLARRPRKPSTSSSVSSGVGKRMPGTDPG